MNLAVYYKNPEVLDDVNIRAMLDELSSCGMYFIEGTGVLRQDTDMLLSIGGDGTFLSAAEFIGASGVPVLGVNMGRLGFLSESRPQDVASHLLSGDLVIEDRQVLQVGTEGRQRMYAFNEACIHRVGPAMLGVDVSLNGERIPTYWADGLLVATSSGSTAYSLSVGGPICTPDAQVLLICPVAPHNLNARPLVVPSDAAVDISLQSRDEFVRLSCDNREMLLPRTARVSISLAQFSLRKARLQRSGFISALRTRLFWGEDVRNENK